MKHCKHCQQPILRVRCDACDGYGGGWVDTGGWDDHWQRCCTCEGGGMVDWCANLDCPGKRWYPLSRYERAIVKTLTADQ